MSGSNTVEACVAKFLRSKHYEEFMANNLWMSPEQGAVVFFRRHTAGKYAYHPMHSEFEHYSNYLASVLPNLKWYQIPVSQKQVAKIRQRTLEKYAEMMQVVA